MYGNKSTKKYRWSKVSVAFFVLYSTRGRGYFCIMDLFEAIRHMRELSKRNISFGFSFMSYNETAQKSEGIVEVRHARLRARTQEAHHRNAEIIEEYVNTDTGEARRFYQPLLLSFNGQKVEA